MKERNIPLQDLKTGYKVFSAVTRGVYQETKPVLTPMVQRMVVRYLKNFSQDKI